MYSDAIPCLRTLQCSLRRKTPPPMGGLWGPNLSLALLGCCGLTPYKRAHKHTHTHTPNLRYAPGSLPVLPLLSSNFYDITLNYIMKINYQDRDVWVRTCTRIVSTPTSGVPWPLVEHVDVAPLYPIDPSSHICTIQADKSTVNISVYHLRTNKGCDNLTKNC